MKNSGVEWIGEIPDDWESIRLKYNYSTTKAKLPKQFFEDKTLIPYLSMDYIRDPDNTEPVYAKDGDYCSEEDILILWDGSNAGEIVFNHPSGYAPSTTAILKKLSNCSLPVFDKFYLKALEDDLRRNTNGMGIPHVSGSYLNNSIFLIPSKETQQKIAAYLGSKCSKIEETIQNQQQVIEKLKAYKQSFITEAVTGKIKIQNGKACGKYKEYKDSGMEYLGSVPSNWNVKRLRYIGKCQNGISKGGEFFGSGYPFVSYGDVYNNLALPETVAGLIESTPEEQDNYSVKAGDIFFTRTSETIEEVGFTSVCLKTIENATFAGFVIRVRPFTDELIPDFSKYYFSSDAHRRFFVKEMNLVTRASLSQELLKRLPVLIPSKGEQKSIADYLDRKCAAIDNSIEQKQKIIEKLTEYKKSLIYECVTGKKAI